MLIVCPECSRDLRVPKDLAGKRVKCKFCAAVFEAVSSGESGVAGSLNNDSVVDRWRVQTGDAQQYGPVTRRELDRWVQDGRLDHECQVLQEGWPQWKWADEVYPELKAQASSPESVAPTTPYIRIAATQMPAASQPARSDARDREPPARATSHLARPSAAKRPDSAQPATGFGGASSPRTGPGAPVIHIASKSSSVPSATKATSAEAVASAKDTVSNPYTSPTELDSSAFARSAGVAEELRRTRPWVLLLALTWLIAPGSLLVFLLFVAVLGGLALSLVLSALTLVVMAAPGFLMWRFQSRIQTFLKVRDEVTAVQALAAQRQIWMTAALLTLLLLVLSILSVVSLTSLRVQSVPTPPPAQTTTPPVVG